MHALRLAAMCRCWPNRLRFCCFPHVCMLSFGVCWPGFRSLSYAKIWHGSSATIHPHDTLNQVRVFWKTVCKLSLLISLYSFSDSGCSHFDLRQCVVTAFSALSLLVCVQRVSCLCGACSEHTVSSLSLCVHVLRSFRHICSHAFQIVSVLDFCIMHTSLVNLSYSTLV